MSAKKLIKTNAMRILEKEKIEYELVTYEVDEKDLSGVHAAEISGVDAEIMYKTLVCKGDKTGHLIAMIPVEETIDLKKLAAASGNKSVQMVKMDELFELTGYIRGGVSPLGTKRNFPIFVDEGIILREKVSVSAGMRGMQLILNAEQLIKAANAKTVDILQ